MRSKSLAIPIPGTGRTLGNGPKKGTELFCPNCRSKTGGEFPAGRVLATAITPDTELYKEKCKSCGTGTCLPLERKSDG